MADFTGSSSSTWCLEHRTF